MIFSTSAEIGRFLAQPGRLARVEFLDGAGQPVDRESGEVLYMVRIVAGRGAMAIRAPAADAPRIFGEAP